VVEIKMRFYFLIWGQFLVTAIDQIIDRVNFASVDGGQCPGIEQFATWISKVSTGLSPWLTGL
jgi:hypothetical protein